MESKEAEISKVLLHPNVSNNAAYGRYESLRNVITEKQSPAKNSY